MGILYGKRDIERKRNLSQRGRVTDNVLYKVNSNKKRKYSYSYTEEKLKEHRRRDNIAFGICMLIFLIFDINILWGWNNIFDSFVNKVNEIFPSKPKYTMSLTRDVMKIANHINSIEFYNSERMKIETDYMRRSTYVIPYDDMVLEVNVPLLNVRKQPNTNSEVVFQYPKGAQFNTTTKMFDHKWYKTPHGFIFGSYIVKASEIKIPEGKDFYIPKKPISKVIYQKSNLTLEQINSLIANTGYADHGQAILDIENNYGVNAFLTIAIANHESDKGRSSLARTNNNLFGFMYGGKPMKFSSKYDSIITFGKNVRKYYFDKGIVDLNTFGPIYCTSGTAEWMRGVPYFIEENYNKIVSIQ